MTDVFARRSRMRIRALFAEIGNHADESTYRLAQDVPKGKYAWIEDGAIQAWPDDDKPPAPPAGKAGSAGTPSERAPLSGPRATEQAGATG
jgi:hypothetical protein